MKNKIIILLLLVSSTAFSQVPGYMGKHFVIGYDNYFLPAIWGPGKNEANPNSIFSPGFNSTHCVNIDITVKNRLNICFSAQHLNTGIAYKKDKYAYPNSSTFTGDFATPAQLSSNNLGFGIKVFRRGSIAPVGKYKKIELLLFFEKVKYQNTKFSTYDYSYGNETAVTLGPGEYNYKNFALAVTFGKQQIFYDKIVLDYGIRIAYTPAFNIITVVSASDNANTAEVSFKQDARFRLFRQQLFNFHIGIGFLAF